MNIESRKDLTRAKGLYLTHARHNRGVSDGAYRILSEIVDFFNFDRGYAWPSLDLIEANTGASRRKIQREVKKLEVLGYIEIRRNGFELKAGAGTANEYTPNWGIAEKGSMGEPLVAGKGVTDGTLISGTLVDNGMDISDKGVTHGTLKGVTDGTLKGVTHDTPSLVGNLLKNPSDVACATDGYNFSMEETNAAKEEGTSNFAGDIWDWNVPSSTDTEDHPFGGKPTNKIAGKVDRDDPFAGPPTDGTEDDLSDWDDMIQSPEPFVGESPVEDVESSLEYRRAYGELIGFLGFGKGDDAGADVFRAAPADVVRDVIVRYMAKQITRGGAMDELDQLPQFDGSLNRAYEVWWAQEAIRRKAFRDRMIRATGAN